jgi:hypothetical protein
MLDPTTRSILVLLAAASVAGCAVPGDLAATGACPTGETCSTEAPHGLFFEGASFSDFAGASGLPIVAAGGTEGVTALTGSGLDSSPFGGLFTATSSDPGALAIDAVAPPSLQVHGHAPADAVVKLFQAGTTDLLDQVDVQVEAISAATLFPSELVVPESAAPTPTTAPWALLAGSAAVPLVVRLQGTSADRLVDEATTLTQPAGAPVRQAWDLFAVTAPAAPGLSSFTIQAGGASFLVTAPVVATIDDLTLIPLTSSPATAAQIGANGADLCFLAQSAGAVVVGATWTFTGSSNLELLPGFTEGSPSCIAAAGTAVGPATLTVAASGFSKTFDLTVTAATKAKMSPHRPARASGSVAGDRAASGDIR